MKQSRTIKNSHQLGKVIRNCIPFIILIGSIAVIYILMALAELGLFISNIVFLLKIDSNISCETPIYTWLAFATITLAISLCSEDGSIINLIATIIVYIYGINYYNDRQLCLSDVSVVENIDSLNSIYALMLTYIILVSISYTLLALLLVSFVICCCILGSETSISSTRILFFDKEINEHSSTEEDTCNWSCSFGSGSMRLAIKLFKLLSKRVDYEVI